MSRRWMTAGIAVALLAAVPAHAQTAGVLDDLVGRFQQATTAWGPVLRNYARGTFALLATIELVWAGAGLAFKGADASEFMGELVRQILGLGFFYALLENSNAWGDLIIQSFRIAGQTASGGPMYPSNVLISGVSVAKKIWDMASIWNAQASAGMIVGGLIILVVFAFIAAWMIQVLVESYIAISASVIMMAFGGSRWTKDIAVAAFRYPLGVGAKLMVLQLLVGIGQTFIIRWADQFTTIDTTGMALMIGASVVLGVVAKTIPDQFQRIVGGHHSDGNALFGAAAAVGAAATGAALGAVGAGAVVSNAIGLAGEQMKASDATAAEQNGGQAPERSRIAHAAAMTGGAARNLGGAVARDVGRRLTGDIGGRHGVASWRMSADLSNKRRLLSDDAEKPAPSPSTTRPTA